MRKLLLALGVVATTLMFGLAVGASAGPDDVCPGEKVDVGNLPATIQGVVITLVDDTHVNFNIVEGTTVVVCVKAGSGQQGDGPEEHTITVDTTFTHSTLKDLSHVSIISVSTPTTSPPTTTTPPPTTTTPPPTTTTPPPTTTTVPPPPPPPVTTTTTPPPTTTTAPPPPPDGGGGAPPPNQGPGENQPPPETLNTPNKLAFTGPEDMLPIGLLAVGLLLGGFGLLRLSRRYA